MRRYLTQSLSHSTPDRRKRKTHRKIKKVAQDAFLIVSIPTLFFCVMFLLFFSKFFAIERIDVLASGGIDPEHVRSILFEEMDTRRFLLAQNGNIFLFDTVSALNAIRASFAVDVLSLRKVFPATLQVTISGKSFAGIWCTQGICYKLFTDGRVSQQVDIVAMGIDPSELPDSFHTTTTFVFQKKKGNTPRGLDMPLFIDEKNNPLPNDQSPLISSSALASTGDMVKLLAEKGISAIFIKTYTQSADMTAVTDEGWSILFTPFEDIPSQSQNLQTVLNTKIKKDRKKLRYIDVRFQNHIYYTFR